MHQMLVTEIKERASYYKLNNRFTQTSAEHFPKQNWPKKYLKKYRSDLFFGEKFFGQKFSGNFFRAIFSLRANVVQSKIVGVNVNSVQIFWDTSRKMSSKIFLKCFTLYTIYNLNNFSTLLNNQFCKKFLAYQYFSLCLMYIGLRPCK